MCRTGIELISVSCKHSHITFEEGLDGLINNIKKLLRTEKNRKYINSAWKNPFK